MPIFLQAQYTIERPDGKGWNRIAIHGGLSMDECAQNRKIWVHSLTRSIRDESALRFILLHVNRNGQCENCPRFY